MSTSLLRFKAKNYRSIFEEQTIDFRSEDHARSVTAVYGPNASGKSNLTHALRFVQSLIVNSTSAQLTQIPIEPFLIKQGSAEKPSSFEIEFLQDERHFVYGFSVTAQVVQKEYLREYASQTNKVRTIFERNQEGLNPSAEKYGFGKRLFEATRPSSLLITKAQENNNPYASVIFRWAMGTNILLGYPQPQGETLQWSIQQLKTNPVLYEPVLELLKEADLWIRAFKITDVTIPEAVINQLPLDEQSKRHLSQAGQASAVQTVHAVRDSQQKIVGEYLFDLGSQESSGTQKFFSLAAPLLDTLAYGKCLYIDEFSAYMHPDMCEFIVNRFKSPTNKNGAQLIINTHDTSLMSQNGPLSREDVLFVEKNFAEETIVTPLSSKSVRAGESFEKRYRQGLYGAKPQIRKEQKLK